MVQKKDIEKKHNLFEKMNTWYQKKKELKESITSLNTQLASENVKNKAMKKNINGLRITTKDKTSLLETLNEKLKSLEIECAQIESQLEKKN